jgi:hypothetical protein
MTLSRKQAMREDVGVPSGEEKYKKEIRELAGTKK